MLYTRGALTGFVLFVIGWSQSGNVSASFLDSLRFDRDYRQLVWMDYKLLAWLADFLCAAFADESSCCVRACELGPEIMLDADQQLAMQWIILLALSCLSYSD